MFAQLHSTNCEVVCISPQCFEVDSFVAVERAFDNPTWSVALRWNADSQKDTISTRTYYSQKPPSSIAQYLFQFNLASRKLFSSHQRFNCISNFELVCIQLLSIRTWNKLQKNEHKTVVHTTTHTARMKERIPVASSSCIARKTLTNAVFWRKKLNSDFSGAGLYFKRFGCDVGITTQGYCHRIFASISTTDATEKLLEPKFFCGKWRSTQNALR